MLIPNIQIMRSCSIEGCKKKHDAKGYCSTHYARFRRNGFADKTIIQRQEHGLSNTAEYTLWSNIKQRCSNPNKKDYIHYGGRGIKLCKEWENDFKYFYEHIGQRPSEKYSLDRIDNEKGYEPGNVRWVLFEVQSNNQRLRKDNKSGVKGVFWNKDRNKWEVYHKGKRMGAFIEKEESIQFKLNLVSKEK